MFLFRELPSRALQGEHGDSETGGLSSPPLTGIQTVSVPPGGAVMTEFKTHVPGAYSIVDHALSRSERGLAGVLLVEGAENPDIFNPAMGRAPRSP